MLHTGEGTRGHGGILTRAEDVARYLIQGPVPVRGWNGWLSELGVSPCEAALEMPKTPGEAEVPLHVHGAQTLEI